MRKKGRKNGEKQNNGAKKALSWGYMLRHPKQGGSNLRVAIRVGPKARDKRARGMDRTGECDAPNAEKEEGLRGTSP